MKKSFLLQNKRITSNLLPWINKCRLIILIDMWLSNGKIMHDYQDVIGLIEKLRKVNAPKNTILYLVGWSWKYDGRYPEYIPAPELGGYEKFKALIKQAHRYEFKVMPHMNYWGMDKTLPDFKRFKKYQAINPNGKKQGWPGRTPNGSTLPFVYISPGAKPWRRYLINKILFAVNSFNLDGIFFDQIFALVNDPRYDFDKGRAILLKELREKAPHILIGGEGVSERLLSSIQFCQIWGRPWCGLQEIPFEKFSLISKELFKDYAFFWAHLGVPSSVPTEYTWTNFKYLKEKGYKKAFRIAQDFQNRYRAIKTLRVSYKDPIITLSI